MKTLYQAARHWMLTEDPTYYRGAGQEINRTGLAEACADALDLHSDAPGNEGEIPDWVFDLAHDVAEEWES
jgi:hypothetical protein